MNNPQRVSVRRCSHTDCCRTSEAVLESKRLCRRHFIDACYVRLDQIAEQIGQKKLHGSVPECSRSFLAECTSQVASEALCAQIEQSGAIKTFTHLAFCCGPDEPTSTQRTDTTTSSRTPDQRSAQRHMDRGYRHARSEQAWCDASLHASVRRG